MMYPNIESLRDSILEYLNSEKEFIESDIKEHLLLSDTEKVNDGLLIESARIHHAMPPYYDLKVSENNTKLRPGDQAVLVADNSKIKIRIIENSDDMVSIESLNGTLDESIIYRIEVTETVLLASLIKLCEKIEDGASGTFWFEQLAGMEDPELEGYKPVSPKGMLPPTFNIDQVKACIAIFKRPSVYCLQGPPGTGKTDVLATIACAYAQQGREVLIISNTHQAVNNALNKIAKTNKGLHITKVGEELKNIDLIKGVDKAKSYNEYLEKRKVSRPKGRHDVFNDIVGMTFHSAIINLGLRKSDFLPSLILVDEAGQMSFVQGALIGAFGCGSVVFIGDDQQMPPIFHEKLKNSVFSTSIFTYLCNLYPQIKSVLTTTYRMNDEITEMVSKNFYEPYGVTLQASDLSAHRRLSLSTDAEDARIKQLLEQEQSIQILNVSEKERWEDSNPEEAMFIAQLINEALKAGLDCTKMAVVTPFRRQVKALRQCVIEILGTNENIPLIDTVERLQGQDVDMIIISLSITDMHYWEQQKQFVLNPNRLNVMISRAKKKVIIVGKYDIFT